MRMRQPLGHEWRRCRDARASSNLFWFEPLGGRLEQPVCGENIVGQSEPPQHCHDLPRSADGELVEAPLPKTRVDAFVQSAPLVDLLALGAVHALAPSGNARAIVGTRRIGIGLVLAVHWRTVDINTNRGCPFSIVILIEAAIDEMAARPSAVAALKFIEHWSHHTAIRTHCIHADRNDDLTFSHSADLTIVSWPETAVRHLHVARLRAPFPLSHELPLLGERSFD